MFDARQVLRPYACILNGRLQWGLEVVHDGKAILEVRPQTGMPDPYVLSVAFVNSHSHLEYRGLQGQIDSGEYWAWIRELTRLKQMQDPGQVASDALTAAQENRRTGVALIGEHSDRPVSGAAMDAAGLQGALFQEVITFFDEDVPEKLAEVDARAGLNRHAWQGPIYRAPHAIFTVDNETLRAEGASQAPISIHVAETEIENELTERGEGLMQELYSLYGLDRTPSGKRVVPTLADLGIIRKDAQLVHVCAVDDDDIRLISASGATVAHCPRSNIALGCPPAPIRELLDAGVQVGLGLDSPASSGPVDMFAEIRAALQISEERGRPVTPEEVWSMATTMGARSIPGIEVGNWDLVPGSTAPLIAIDVAGAHSTDDLLFEATPEHVRWLT